MTDKVSVRKSVTTALTLAAQSYWLHKGFSCFTEIGLESWGRLRADFVALSLSADIVICEVKSSRADYSTDKKWHKYLEYSNSMYFVLTFDVWKQLKDKMEEDGVFDLGIGVLVLSPETGYLVCVKPCKRRPLPGPKQRTMVTRLAWRNGVSKRTDFRVRQFIGPEGAVSTRRDSFELPPDWVSEIGPKKSRRRPSRRKSRTRYKKVYAT